MRKIFMGGLVDAIFGGDDEIVQPPKREVITGQVVGEKAVGGFEEEEESKLTARTTARKGTTQFRIPLAGGIAGAKLTGKGAGLKI